MSICEITTQMIAQSGGNLADINHFLKVYAFAKTIGEAEQLDADTQAVLEAAAILHDIACPLCREKYGSTQGKYQEAEGQILAAAFLKELGYPKNFVSRVAFLGGRHHTFTNVSGSDYQILLEADYLVNAGEHGYSRENIANTLQKVFGQKQAAACCAPCIYSPSNLGKKIKGGRRGRTKGFPPRRKTRAMPAR